MVPSARFAPIAILVIGGFSTIAFFFDAGTLPRLGVAAVGVAALLILVLLARITVSPRRSALALGVSRQVDGRLLRTGRDSGRSLFGLVGLALALRCVVATVLSLTDLSTSIAPDHTGYREIGRLIAASWDNPWIDPTIVNGFVRWSFVHYLNAVTYWITGADTSFLLSYVSAFVGTAAAWLCGKTAEEIYGPEAGRRAFILAAFFPSLVLWSSMNLKDAWSFLSIAAVLLGTQRLQTRIELRSMLILGLGLIGLTFIRPYMLFLVLLGLGLALLTTRLRQIPYILLSLAIIALVLSAFGSQNPFAADLMSETRLERVQQMRIGLTSGRSSYGLEGDVSTTTGALLYLPRGISYFLLSPFPWSIERLRQGLALPETFVWYAVLVAGVRGAWTSVRTNLARVAAPLMVSAVIILGYSLVEGNVGTAYRHRAQAMLIIFVFAAGDYAQRRVAARANIGKTADRPELTSVASVLPRV